MNPSHAAATPMVARNVGSKVVAVSCDQSLSSEVSPTPTTVRFNHRGRALRTVLLMPVPGLVGYRGGRAVGAHGCAAFERATVRCLRECANPTSTARHV